jgi:hypothetical protein
MKQTYTRAIAEVAHRLSACCRICSAPSPAAGADDAAVGPGPAGSAIGGDSSTSTALSARLQALRNPVVQLNWLTENEAGRMRVPTMTELASTPRLR